MGSVFENLQQKIFAKVKFRFVFFSSAVCVSYLYASDSMAEFCCVALAICHCERFISHGMPVDGNFPTLGERLCAKVPFKLQCCGRFQSSIIFFRCVFLFFSFKVVYHISAFFSLFDKSSRSLWIFRGFNKNRIPRKTRSNGTRKQNTENKHYTRSRRAEKSLCQLFSLSNAIICNTI